MKTTNMPKYFLILNMRRIRYLRILCLLLCLTMCLTSGSANTYVCEYCEAGTFCYQDKLTSCPSGSSSPSGSTSVSDCVCDPGFYPLYDANNKLVSCDLFLPMQLQLRIDPMFLQAWKCYLAGHDHLPLLPGEISIIRQDQAMFHHVLTMRELAVCRSMKLCMHCHQRTYHFSSFMVSDPSHRKMCRVCWSMYYVKTNVLASTYKLHLTPDVKERLEHHVCRILFREDDYNEGIFHMAYHKTELASGLGYESWDEFIKRNYLHPQPFSRMKARGIFRYHFNRTAFCEAL